MNFGLRKGNNKVIVFRRVVFSWLLLILVFRANQLSCSKFIQSAHHNSISNILPNEDFNYSFEKIGQYLDRYGSPGKIIIQDDLAFVSSLWGGLLIFNISTPSQPILISTFIDDCIVTESDNCVDESISLAVNNNLAFLAHGRYGLLIIDVTNPAEPYLLGRYARFLYDVKVQDNLAYLRCPGIRPINYGNVIQIVNISDTSNPELVGELDYSLIGGYMLDIAIQSDFIYCVSDDYLVTINATITSSPEEISRLNINGANRLFIENNYVYATNFTTLKIIDITSPTIPILVNELPLEMESISSIFVTNTTAFISDLDGPKIIAVNITDVIKPTQIGLIENYTTYGYNSKQLSSRMIEQGNELLFCSDSRLGLFCFNVSDMSNITLLGYFDTNCKATALTIDSDFAYLCSRREGPNYPSRLEIISITNRSKPFLIGRFDFYGDTLRHIVVSNGLAYLSLAAGGLVIMDVSDPTFPIQIGSYSHNATIGFFENLWYDETTQQVYLAHPYYGLLIINCSDPTTPTLVSTYEISQPFYLSNLFIEDDIAYLTSSSSEGGIVFVDVSNPKEPTLLYRTSVGDAIVDIQIFENQAYLALQYNYLIILDVSAPTAPLEIGVLKNWWYQTQALFVNNSITYIAQYGAGLRAVDISDSMSPDEIAAIRDHYRGLCFDVYIQGEHIFIADGWDGLEIYKLIHPKILPKNYLLMIILPTTGGVVLIATIVIIQVVKRRKNISL